MTALIKLTLPTCEFYQEEGVTLINPANITQIYRGRGDDNNTYVEMTSGITRVVKETPEEIIARIRKADIVNR